MKIVLLVFLVLILGSAGCKSKKLSSVEYASREDFIIEHKTEEVSEPQIRAMEESFTFTRDQDKDLHDQYQYFVIIGSYRNRNNAENFTQTMVAKGFVPVILLSETGLHRISVNSYLQENQARDRIMQIRNSFPEHADTWLLIRK